MTKLNEDMESLKKFLAENIPDLEAMFIINEEHNPKLE